MSGRGLQGARCNLLRGALATLRPGLPDRAPALDPFDGGIDYLR